MTLAISPSTCSSRTGTWPASPASLLVSTRATISPVSASTARCNLRQDRRARPCFSPSHSPFSNSLRPVLSSSRCKGPCGTPCGRRLAKARPRRLRVGVVRNREIKPEKPEHAAGEALSLAQGQVEDEPQRQNQLDRQVRIKRLSAWCGP